MAGDLVGWFWEPVHCRGGWLDGSPPGGWIGCLSGVLSQGQFSNVGATLFVLPVTLTDAVPIWVVVLLEEAARG